MNQKNVLIAYFCCVGASVSAGSDTYPVYCFWVGKTVAHVPGGGDLKRIVMFPSTGEEIVLNPDSEVIGGGDWLAIGVGLNRYMINTQRSAFGRAWRSRYPGQTRQTSKVERPYHCQKACGRTLKKPTTALDLLNTSTSSKAQPMRAFAFRAWLQSSCNWT